jgi:hypothetical protein
VAVVAKVGMLLKQRQFSDRALLDEAVELTNDV